VAYELLCLYLPASLDRTSAHRSLQQRADNDAVIRRFEISEAEERVAQRAGDGEMAGGERRMTVEKLAPTPPLDVGGQDYSCMDANPGEAHGLTLTSLSGALETVTLR
jgi:hypothetical protein